MVVWNLMYSFNGHEMTAQNYSLALSILLSILLAFVSIIGQFLGSSLAEVILVLATALTSGRKKASEHREAMVAFQR